MKVEKKDVSKLISSIAKHQHKMGYNEGFKEGSTIEEKLYYHAYEKGVTDTAHKFESDMIKNLFYVPSKPETKEPTIDLVQTKIKWYLIGALLMCIPLIIAMVFK